jgi:fibronectin type 3 domain-containing protein
MLSHKYLWWWIFLVVLAGCDSNAQAVQTAAPTTSAAPTTISAPVTTTAPTTTVAPVITVAPTTTAVSRPAAFQVNAQSADTQLRLNWTAVAGASGYYVYRDGSATALNATPLAEPQYVDIGLTNGRSYAYQIAAVDQAGLIVARSPALTASPKAP